jgi:hypothetical protein
MRSGFTRVEFLVIFLILAVLTGVTFFNLRLSQIKARDAQRKDDLRQTVKALGAYYEDHGSYPLAEEASGKMKACGCGSGVVVCDWDRDEGQREFCDEKNIVYMLKVPGDPAGQPRYCYWAGTGGNSFKLYAKLENNRDPEVKGPYSCGEREDYNFGIASPRVEL